MWFSGVRGCWLGDREEGQMENHKEKIEYKITLRYDRNSFDAKMATPILGAGLVLVLAVRNPPKLRKLQTRTGVPRS